MCFRSVTPAPGFGLCGGGGARRRPAEGDSLQHISKDRACREPRNNAQRETRGETSEERRTRTIAPGITRGIATIITRTGTRSASALASVTKYVATAYQPPSTTPC